MKEIVIGNRKITQDGPAFFIAEIGHNHQGSLEIADEMVRVAAQCGVDAVKLQKRDNRTLFTKAGYNRPYENENSYGATYGEHREYLEFGRSQFLHLKQLSEELGVEFFATAFDEPSADFLAEIGVRLFKIASYGLTDTPLLRHVATFGLPMFVSTGASTLDEIRRAYDTVMPLNQQLVLLHCVSKYPAGYEDLNLRRIELLSREFPDVLIGYSDHHPGIEPASVAYQLGARVFEKHFTLNRANKGTDHGFSLEPTGLEKQIEALRHVPQMMGDPSVELQTFEREPRQKLSRGLYVAQARPAGHVLTLDDLALKTPATGLPAYMRDEVVGRTLAVPLAEETPLLLEHLEPVSVPA